MVNQRSNAINAAKSTDLKSCPILHIKAHANVSRSTAQSEPSKNIFSQMKTQFAIDAVLVLENGKIVIGGTASERPLIVGECGRVLSKFGYLDIKVVSIGLLTPRPSDPKNQALMVEVPTGDPKWLEGTTAIFE